MKRLLLAALLLGAFSVRAAAPAYTDAPAPPAGKALIYVYRPHNSLHSPRSGGFYIDKKLVVTLKDQGYTWLHLTEGEHVLEHRKTSNPLDERVGGKVTITAGRTYFYRLEVGLASRDVHWVLSEQRASAALPEIERCSYQKAGAKAL
jgi:uncharacterized protein DUF2846